IAPGAVNSSVPVYVPGRMLWLRTTTWIAAVAPGGTTPDKGEALNQLPAGPSARNSDNWAVGVAWSWLASDQENGRVPGLLMVSVCAAGVAWPSLALNDSRAGDKVSTGPGGKGSTLMSTSTCCVGLTFVEMARSPLYSPGLSPTRCTAIEMV